MCCKSFVRIVQFRLSFIQFRKVAQSCVQLFGSVCVQVCTMFVKCCQVLYAQLCIRFCCTVLLRCVKHCKVVPTCVEFCIVSKSCAKCCKVCAEFCNMYCFVKLCRLLQTVVIFCKVLHNTLQHFTQLYKTFQNLTNSSNYTKPYNIFMFYF